MKSKVVGVAGSIRSNQGNLDSLLSCVCKAFSHDDLTKRIKQLSVKFANTDVALAFALFAAYKSGAEVDIVSLRGLFKTVDGNSDTFDHLKLDDAKVGLLLKKMKNADGVILSTPTYFGDRSSVANKFFQLVDSKDLLKDKVFGAIAVGAKRNGGQETTCIYCIVDALAQTAIAVGNGPITSQYGGTVVAGDKMTALEDDWGLERCKELGSKIAYTCSLVSVGRQDPPLDKSLNICVLMTMDTPDKQYRLFVDDYFEPLRSQHKVDVVDLIDYPIKRCLACDTCPKLGKSEGSPAYRCIIQDEDDCVVVNHKKLLDADVIVLVGVNSEKDIVYRYQAFVERTRCIRRDNYQLSNTPMASLLVSDLRAHKNTLHNSKVITSYIRHNTIILAPMQITLLGDEKVYETDYTPLIAQAQMIKTGREKACAYSVCYAADGYADKSQDCISSKR